MKFSLSLRAKFTLALLTVSLISLLSAGLLARVILFQQFNRIVMEEAFQRFHGDVTAYIKAYGSWEAAHQQEPLKDFIHRHRSQARQTPSAAPSITQRPAPLTPGNEISPRDAIRNEQERPPFRFGLADPQGRILIGPPHEIGSLAPPELIKAARPVVVNGQTKALALPDPRPNLNRLDLGYLRAIRLALIAASVTAAVVALALGLIIGTRLSLTLRELTSAIKGMQDGDLHQSVKVRSSDEFGVLAGAFNRMSADLAQAYEELRKSNLQISEQAQQLKELSIRDELTGLYNRRHFNEQAAQLFAEARRYEQPLTVIISDVDFFKKINDTYSHATGDEVLRRIAQILHEHTRASDVLARYGGEEFVLLLPQTPLDHALVLCEKLRRQIEEHPWHEIHPDLRVTMSFGLSGDTTQENFEKQLALADGKLYEAKNNGRNCIGYNTVQANG